MKMGSEKQLNSKIGNVLEKYVSFNKYSKALIARVGLAHFRGVIL